MQSYSIFPEDESIKFKQAVKKYITSLNYRDMDLTDNELAQLRWHMGNKSPTPEARGEISELDFEIKRGLARYYSFKLLLEDDETAAYKEFIQAQNENKLDFSSFNKLSQQAKLLTPDVKAVIRASCFLVASDKAREVLKEKEIVLSKDSEEFLSQFAVLSQKNKTLFPLTKELTESQLSLLPKVYWPNMQFRHMLYTEGGDNMTKTFADGVSDGNFGGEDFLLWKWRWLTNLFGFQSGPGAKYYDQPTHSSVATVLSELEKILDDPLYSYLDNYLLKRAELAGLTHEKLSKPEQKFLGHLAAYCTQVNVITPELGKRIYEAYIEFKKEFNVNEELAVLYEKLRKDKEAATPTYVPSVMNNAYFVFKNKLKLSEEDSLQNASQFICQLLFSLYALSHDKRISCYKLSQVASLEGILEKWQHNHSAFEFKVNENLDLIAEETPKLKLTASR